MIRRTLAVAAAITIGAAASASAAEAPLAVHQTHIFPRPERITVTAATNPNGPVTISDVISCSDGSEHTGHFTMPSYAIRPLTIPSTMAASCRVSITASSTRRYGSIAIRMHSEERGYKVPKLK